MPQLPPSASASFVTTNGFGTGSIKLGPNFYAEQWHVTNIAVQVTHAADSWTVEARAYTGPAIPENIIGGTYDGKNDNIGVDITLGMGEIITVEWSNPNGLAGFPTLTASLYGEQIISGNS